MKNAFLFIIFSSFVCRVMAVDTHSVVYRADDRDMLEIRNARGMYPFPGEINDNMLQHFEGEDTDERTSAFVSTTSDFAQAIQHAAFHARSNDEEPIDPDYVSYVYEIRPDDDFYDLEGSIRVLRRSYPDESEEHRRLSTILSEYGHMNEYDAFHGFNSDRIIRYISLTGQQLIDNPLSRLQDPDFWRTLWRTENTHYNHDYDRNVTNSEPFRIELTMPLGYRLMLDNAAGEEIPVGAGCSAVRRGGGESSYKSSTCEADEDRAMRQKYYDKGLFYLLTE